MSVPRIALLFLIAVLLLIAGYILRPRQPSLATLLLALGAVAGALALIGFYDLI